MLLFLLACSEYELNKNTDATGTSESTDTTGTSPETNDPNDGQCPPDDGTYGVNIDESCQIDPVVGTFSPVIEWSSRSPGASYVTPIVGNLDDDNGDGSIGPGDRPDVVMINEQGTITVMEGDGSAIKWTGRLRNAIGPSTPALGDINGDGRPDLVFVGGAGTFAAYEGATGAELWETTVSQLGARGECGAVGLYDLDGDGAVEVVIGNVILRGTTGAVRGIGTAGKGTGYTGSQYASFGVAADIDQDGDQEVVVGNALYDADGNTIWNNHESDGFVAVANFDDDPYGEIVVTWYPGMVRLQDDDGSVLWQGSYTGSTIGPPTVADFDGDGEPEIGVAGMSRYVVIDTDGQLLWSNPTQDASSGFTGSAVFDFEGDGQAEVVYADEVSLWVFDGATGAVKLEETAHSSVTCSESPAIADVDADGHAEILYSSYPYTGSETGVTVVGDADDSWMPARSIWNQHAYAITNIDEDGTVPAQPDTNWLSYNNFRSADLSAPGGGGAMSDAVPANPWVCTEECDRDKIFVTVRVGNSGTTELPAGVPWTLYAKDGGAWNAVKTGSTTEAVPPGGSTSGDRVRLDPAEVPEGKLRLVVDDDGGSGALTECHEDNNTVEIEAACP